MLQVSGHMVRLDFRRPWRVMCPATDGGHTTSRFYDAWHRKRVSALRLAHCTALYRGHMRTASATRLARGTGSMPVSLASFFAAPCHHTNHKTALGATRGARLLHMRSRVFLSFVLVLSLAALVAAQIPIPGRGRPNRPPTLPPE